MKREIKFRCWTGSVMEPWERVKDWESLGRHLGKQSRFIWMQFTGLNDKNGKEIYEGDVLAKIATDYEHEDYPAYVDSGYETKEPTRLIYDYCTLERFGYWLKNEHFGWEGEDLEDPEHWEVIGNIYQNPELLKQ